MAKQRCSLSFFQSTCSYARSLAGTFFFGNGDRYVGQWRDGLFHGRGTYTSVSGASYAGDWIEGLRHGGGSMIDCDQSIYQGGWALGQRSGRGDLTSLDGFKYRGTWLHDAPEGADAADVVFLFLCVLKAYLFLFQLLNSIPLPLCTSALTVGKGEMTFADSSRYDGGFRDGKREGRGTYVFKHGQQYSGRFTSDAIEASAPGTLLMPHAVPLAAGGEWMLPVNVGDMNKVHVRAGFDKDGH